MLFAFWAWGGLFPGSQGPMWEQKVLTGNNLGHYQPRHTDAHHNDHGWHQPLHHRIKSPELMSRRSPQQKWPTLQTNVSAERRLKVTQLLDRTQPKSFAAVPVGCCYRRGSGRNAAFVWLGLRWFMGLHPQCDATWAQWWANFPKKRAKQAETFVQIYDLRGPKRQSAISTSSAGQKTHHTCAQACMCLWGKWVTRRCMMGRKRAYADHKMWAEMPLLCLQRHPKAGK